MALVFTNIYLFFLALVLAILEIQIEGKYGWAHHLPTWRPKGENIFLKMYKKFMSGREATGYHMAMFSFVLMILHMPYFFALTFNIENYLKTWSFFFIFVVLWDFLWFVLNPHHPLKKFKKEHIWWHKKWLGGAPLDYYLSLLLSFLILLPIIFLNKDISIINWWLAHVLLFVLQLVLTILFSLFVLKIDNWEIKK